MSGGVTGTHVGGEVGLIADDNARDAAIIALQTSVAGRYVRPGTGIPESDFDAATQAKLDNAAVTAVTTRVVKPAGTARTSTTTFADDPDWGGTALPLVANTNYEFSILAHYAAGTTGDLKLQFTGPSGATITATCLGIPLGAAAGAAPVMTPIRAFSSYWTVGGVGDAVQQAFSVEGTISVGSTAGYLALQTAQVAVDTVASNIYSRSRLILTPVS